jgi:SAM-dependent methyltransferase
MGLNMKSELYPEKISAHYEAIARKFGASSSATMEDVYVRTIETQIVERFVSHFAPGDTVVDIGCGNGYTLEVLAKKYPALQFLGIEPSKSLREIAKARLGNFSHVQVRDGNLINFDEWQHRRISGVISQRVVINIIETSNQVEALKNLAAFLKKHPDNSSRKILLIEGYESPHRELNEARREFQLPDLSPAHHNLLLPEDLFGLFDSLIDETREVLGVYPHHLSSHYYVTRVLHEHVAKNHDFVRNSRFVQFFDTALPPGIGDFATIKFRVFSA